MLYRIRVLLEHFTNETGSNVHILKSKTFDVSKKNAEDLTHTLQKNFRTQPQPIKISYRITETYMYLDLMFIVIDQNNDLENLLKIYYNEAENIIKSVNNSTLLKNYTPTDIGNFYHDSMILSVSKSGISHFDNIESQTIIKFLHDRSIEFKIIQKDEIEYHGGSEGGAAEILILIKSSIEDILMANEIYEMIKKFVSKKFPEIRVKSIETKNSKEYMIKKYIANENNIYIDNLIVESVDYNKVKKETTFVVKNRYKIFSLTIDDANRIIKLDTKNAGNSLG